MLPAAASLLCLFGYLPGVKAVTTAWCLKFRFSVCLSGTQTVRETHVRMLGLRDHQRFQAHMFATGNKMMVRALNRGQVQDGDGCAHKIR